MDSAIATLLQRLVEGPAFLLLGQELDDPAVPVPQPALPGPGADAAYAEYDRLVGARPLPRWLPDIADYPWNGVFTSRIDSTLLGVFRRDWRGLEPTAQPQVGRHPRLATKLQLRYLFGGLARVSDDHRLLRSASRWSGTWDSRSRSDWRRAAGIGEDGMSGRESSVSGDG